MSIKPIVSAIVMLFGVAACATQPYAISLAFDQEKRLYTSDKVGHKISELPTLLDRLLSDGKPVILFVHGRGNEPKKSLEGGALVKGRAVHRLEKEYKANVVMFNWDSKRGKGLKDRSRPLSNMQTAAQAFAQVMEGIKLYREENPQSQSLALLAHSMGNIVVETVVKNQGVWIANDGKPLFSNIIFSASDADNIAHATWIEKISNIENVYITTNADDNVLKRSTEQRPPNTAALGLEPGNILATKAIYIDVTDLGTIKGMKTERHVLFDKPGMHDQVHVCEFFQQALTGQPVAINSQNSQEVVSGQRYKLKFLRDNANECFK